MTDEIASYLHHHGGPDCGVAAGAAGPVDPLVGYTELGLVGLVVSELSPYQTDLDWTELTEPTGIAPVLDHLGRATAKVHRVSDSMVPPPRRLDRGRYPVAGRSASYRPAVH